MWEQVYLQTLYSFPQLRVVSLNLDAYTGCFSSQNVLHCFKGQHKLIHPPSTPCAEPDSPPGNLVTSSTRRNEIDVSWDPPPLEEQNGIITHYNVCYEVEGGTQTEQCVVVPPSLTSTTLTVGISTGTTYLIRIAAATSVGLGPFSVDLQQSTLIEQQGRSRRLRPVGRADD